MNPNLVIAIAYLLSEAVNQGLKISDILRQADESGALPPDVSAKIKAALKDDFNHAKEFWGVQ